MQARWAPANGENVVRQEESKARSAIASTVLSRETHMIQHVLARLRAEYLEMPGLRLKAEQVQRLCGIEPPDCQSVLDALVEAKFLCVTAGGLYARLTDGEIPHPRPAKAELRADQQSMKAS